MRNGLTKTNGIHLVIEDTKKSPSILSNGISVKPGAETNIGLKIGTISRLEAPFASKCRIRYPHENFDRVRFLAYFEYSAKNCKSWCYIGMILDTCHCLEHTIMEGILAEDFLEWVQHFNISICKSTAGSPQYDCVRNVLLSEDHEALIQNCSCGAECFETEYKVIVYFQFI